MRRARSLLVLLVLFVLLAGSADLATAAADEAPTRVLVELTGANRATALTEVMGQLEAADAVPTGSHVYGGIPWVAVDVPAKGVDVLRASGAVGAVVPDRLHPVALTQTVPLIRADEVVNDGFDGTGTTVAVLDTGVETSHPFLTGRTITELCYSSGGGCPGGATTASGAGSATPCTYASTSVCAHGTHVAGIAVGKRTSGSSSNPAQGVAPGANLLAIQVFSPDGHGSAGAADSDILAALDYVRSHAASMNIASVNLSLGGSDYTSQTSCNTDNPSYLTMFAQLRAVGVAPVVAAGNSGLTNAVSAPACVTGAIAVAATTKSNTLASYSDTGPMVSIAAPGDSVTSSITGGAYGVKSGTSMATPHVAGAFALLHQASPSSGVSTVLSTLQTTGVTISGIKRIDVAAALTSLVPTPGAPTAVAATPGDRTLDLSWTAPVWHRTDVTGYQVTGSGTITVSGTTAHVTGLTNGTSATYAVVATSAAGSSPAASVTATPMTTPTAPTNVAASAGSSGAIVTWSPPASDGGGTLSYRVKVAETGATISAGSSLSATASNLSPGATYTFTVIASNAAGDSPSSTAASVTIPSASGGGGGGGGGGSTATTTTSPTTSTTVAPTPNATSPAPSPAPAPLPIVKVPQPAVPVPGGVVVVRNGAPVKLDLFPPFLSTAAAAAATPSGNGAWLSTPDGRVVATGDAPDLGSLDIHLNQPIVGMTSTISGKGYWLLGSDGGVFSFGDARFFGSTGAMRLNQPVISIAASPTGNGYWLLARDGGIFTFGDAAFYGSTGNLRLNNPVVSVAVTSSGRGYWLASSDGGVFTFGDARFFGAGSKGHPISALAPAPSGHGYWLLSGDGATLPYGDVSGS